MKNKSFRAFLVEKKADDKYVGTVVERNIEDLPKGDVVIKVEYSSLNLKDAFSASGVKGITRNYPHIPGIDAAGIVEESSDDRYTAGDKVLITGYDFGMNTSGGFGEYVRVPADWIVNLPDGLTSKESMMYGTAGFTAALCIKKMIDKGVGKDDGEILVTGATGGVGSIAVGLLSKLGYRVIAGTGKEAAKEMLQGIGAADIILRSELDDVSGKALLKERWAGVVDTVGGNILATAIKSTKYTGVVTSCGNAASAELNLTVFPFILKGISLLGVDSVQCPMPLRIEIWKLLADEWKLERLEDTIQTVPLEAVGEKLELMLKGQLTGRVVVEHRK